MSKVSKSMPDHI